MQGPVEIMASKSAMAALSVMFAQAPDAIGVSDRSGTILMVNPAMLQLFGYAKEPDMMGRTVLEMMSPAARETIATMMRRRALGESLPGVYRSRGLRADGTEMPIEVRTAPFQVDGHLHVMSIIRTISEEETGHPVQGRGGEFYRALFNVNTAVKLLIEPTTGVILDANQAALELYGWPLDALLQMRISDINMLTREEVQQEMENARLGRRRYFRFRHRIADGSIRHVEVHSGPVEMDGRQLLLSIIHDVTERNVLEEQLLESQRLDVVGKLAGGVAHDFNNLLTVIMSATDFLIRETPSDSPLRPFAEDVAHAARRGADLTRQLLAFSRRQVMDRQAVALDDLLPHLTAMLKRMLGANYALSCMVEPATPSVSVDAGKLEQVLMNLALNARDAMPDGGPISITAAQVKPAEQRELELPEGNWIAVRVQDQGAGMDQETRRHLFEPFFTTRPGVGSGFGLATAHGIIRQSDGYIHVASKPGKGSIFSVVLPEAIGRDVRLVSPPKTQGAHSGSVALVEDMPDVRRTLSAGLAAGGFRVREFSSAEEVLQLPVAELAAFDALVSDVVMPGISGIDLAHQLALRVPMLPVLLMSGELQENSPSTFPPEVRFMTKPFTAEALRQEVVTLMSRT